MAGQPYMEERTTEIDDLIHGMEASNLGFQGIVNEDTSAARMLIVVTCETSQDDIISK
jgi:hypothetical protein